VLTRYSWGCLAGIKREKAHPAEVQAVVDSIGSIMQEWTAGLSTINDPALSCCHHSE